LRWNCYKWRASFGLSALLTAISAQTRQVIRAVALWLGVFALMVQTLAPAYAASVAAGEGSSIVICTAHGFQTVHVDADGNAIPGKSSANSSDCCNDYHAAGGFIVPTPGRLPAPFHITSEASWFAAPASIAPRFYSSYVTRGPPLLVI